MIKSLWASEYYFYISTMIEQLPIKALSLPSRFRFAQPVQYGRLTVQFNSNQFLIDISRHPSSQNIQFKTFMTVSTCDSPPSCHQESSWEGKAAAIGKASGLITLKQDKLCG